MPNPFAVLDEEAATAPLKASTPAVVEVKPKTATATTQQKSAANGNQQRGKQQQRGDSLKRAPRPTGSSVEQAGGDSGMKKIKIQDVTDAPQCSRY
jgi:hypothetical protein